MLLKMLGPVLLASDNVTPTARTPWGGHKIARHYKAGLGLELPEQIGESWEVSVEPSFPSRSERGHLLTDLIAADPTAWLGHAASRFGQLPLLVKLLDAADNLSVQVHPHDGDPALMADESGKPEAWVILDHEPGAGLYLGFREDVSREQVADCLDAGSDLRPLLNFVPVSRGEAFVIEAGTVHAIGAGITLIEPQFVRPGRRGLTYRFWDWNRRYNKQGRRDPAGQGRTLHRERSLAVTRWDGPRGPAFVEGCRVVPESIVSGAVCRERVVNWSWFCVERWRGQGPLTIEPSQTLWALCCTAGEMRLQSRMGTLALKQGQSGVVPAAAAELVVELAADSCVFATRCQPVVDAC